jgi:hypothetical protein
MVDIREKKERLATIRPKTTRAVTFLQKDKRFLKLLQKKSKAVLHSRNNTTGGQIDQKGGKKGATMQIQLVEASQCMFLGFFFLQRWSKVRPRWIPTQLPVAAHKVTQQK